MYQPGPQNALTDITGLSVGHASHEQYSTGVTVIHCAHPMTASVDVRGGGPGTRETDLLATQNQIQQIHALCLTGGSVFGLAAADSVICELSQRREGLKLSADAPAIPLVPAATLYDLEYGGSKNWGQCPPYFELGRQALLDCKDRFQLGSVGAGRGAQAGTLKGGIGTASLDLGHNGTVSALVAVNSIGAAIMPDGQTPYAWAYELNAEFGNPSPPTNQDLSHPLPEYGRLNASGRLQPGANTTLCVIACSFGLTRPELQRVAMMAHDGIARAIRPAHLPFDGDTIFALSANPVDPIIDPMARALTLCEIGAAAADCVTRAIARGVYEANRS